MGDLILAIDQGTTGSTALLVDSAVNVLASHNVEFPNHYPQPGHVEHDVEEIWTSIAGAVEGALAKARVSADRIAGIAALRLSVPRILADLPRVARFLELSAALTPASD